MKTIISIVNVSCSSIESSSHALIKIDRELAKSILQHRALYQMLKDANPKLKFIAFEDETPIFFTLTASLVDNLEEGDCVFKVIPGSVDTSKLVKENVTNSTLFILDEGFCWQAARAVSSFNGPIMYETLIISYNELLIS
jgi:hypothetical protein